MEQDLAEDGPSRHNMDVWSFRGRGTGDGGVGGHSLSQRSSVHTRWDGGISPDV